MEILRRSAMKRIFLHLLACCIIFSAAGAGAEEASGSIQIKGSDTMVNLAQLWAEEFMSKNPDAMVAVTGGGSGTGIAAIINGTCDIAQSSREMKDQELEAAKSKGREVKEFKVAIDALAVIVHPANPVTQLTVDDLARIFTGEVTHWKDLGGKDQEILVLSRERNSGTHVYFLEEVLRKGNAKGPEEFAPRTLMLPSSQAIVHEVAGSETAIGYLGIGYVNDQVRPLAIAKTPGGPFVLPAVDTALDESYALSRPLLMYTAKNPEGVIQAFLDYVLSDAGQDAVLAMDFVPLRKRE
jgi:phosphate transport system substrate-binding protein